MPKERQKPKMNACEKSMLPKDLSYVNMTLDVSNHCL